LTELDSLDAGYSEKELLAVLAGEKTHTPRRKKSGQPESPKVNFLVDIQAKFQTGKGAGYARWASVFPLKQMAQTLQSLQYLTEHNLLDSAALAARMTKVSEQFQELPERRKSPPCKHRFQTTRKPVRSMWLTVRPGTRKNSRRNTNVRFCSTRVPKNFSRKEAEKTASGQTFAGGVCDVAGQKEVPFRHVSPLAERASHGSGQRR